MRSGNTFIVTGDLITGLDFSIENTLMGQTFKTNDNSVIIKIKFFDPDSANFNTYSDYTNPKVNHIDLIAGKVTGMISPESTKLQKG